MGPVFHNTSRAVGRGSNESAAAVYNEIFSFTFPWYALIAVWTWLWHPVLLRLWLGQNIGAAISPMFVPIIVGCCFTAISNISGAQLGPLNRVGTGLIFNILTAALLVTGVLIGWDRNGIIGVAWGFFFSRIIGLIQDLYVIRLVNAGGWLATATWKQLALQIGIGVVFSATMLLWPRQSFWQLAPAFLHGVVASALLLSQPIRNLLFQSSATTASGVP
jgi:Na+-driven multidrug efflux pump